MLQDKEQQELFIDQLIDAVRSLRRQETGSDHIHRLRAYFKTAISRGADINEFKLANIALLDSAELMAAVAAVPDKLSSESRASFSGAGARRTESNRWNSIFGDEKDEVYFPLAADAKSVNEQIGTFIEEHNRQAEQKFQTALVADPRNAGKSIEQREIRRDPEKPSALQSYNRRKGQWETGPRLGAFLYERGEWGLVEDFKVDNGAVPHQSAVHSRFQASLKEVASRKYESADVFDLETLMVVVSRDPQKIGEMSSGQHWQSCMTEGAMNFHYVPHDIEAGTLIAYVVSRDDTEARYPLMRALLKPYRNAEGQTVLVPAKIYGAASGAGSAFASSLSSFARSVNGDKTGIFQMDPQLYPDGQATTITVNDVLSPEILEIALTQYHDNSLHDMQLDLKIIENRVAEMRGLSSSKIELFGQERARMEELLDEVGDSYRQIYPIARIHVRAALEEFSKLGPFYPVMEQTERERVIHERHTKALHDLKNIIAERIGQSAGDDSAMLVLLNAQAARLYECMEKISLATREASREGDWRRALLYSLTCHIDYRRSYLNGQLRIEPQALLAAVVDSWHFHIVHNLQDQKILADDERKEIIEQETANIRILRNDAALKIAAQVDALYEETAGVSIQAYREAHEAGIGSLWSALYRCGITDHHLWDALRRDAARLGWPGLLKALKKEPELYGEIQDKGVLRKILPWLVSTPAEKKLYAAITELQETINPHHEVLRTRMQGIPADKQLQTLSIIGHRNPKHFGIYGEEDMVISSLPEANSILRRSRSIAEPSYSRSGDNDLNTVKLLSLAALVPERLKEIELTVAATEKEIETKEQIIAEQKECIAVSYKDHPSYDRNETTAICDHFYPATLYEDKAKIERRIKTLRDPRELALSFFRLMRKTAVGSLPDPHQLRPLANKLVSILYPKGGSVAVERKDIPRVKEIPVHIPREQSYRRSPSRGRSRHSSSGRSSRGPAARIA